MKLSSEKIQTIIELRNQNFSVDYISNLLGLSVSTVHKYLKNQKGYVPKNKQYWLDLKKDYFKIIDTPEKAYFLGFIAGDGNVINNQIRIRIVKDDVEILNAFKKEINYNKPNKFVKVKNGQEQVHLEFRSFEMCNDLKNFGIVPNKSMKLQLPTSIDDDLMHAYLLGLFDADGSIFYTKFRRSDRKTQTERYGFSITTNTVLADQISSYLEKKIGVVLSVSRKRNNKNLSIAQLSRNQDLIKLCDFLYKDLNLGLLRKKIKFQEAYSFYQNGCSTTTISTPIKGDGIVSSYVKA